MFRPYTRGKKRAPTHAYPYARIIYQTCEPFVALFTLFSEALPCTSFIHVYAFPNKTITEKKQQDKARCYYRTPKVVLRHTHVALNR